MAGVKVVRVGANLPMTGGLALHNGLIQEGIKFAIEESESAGDSAVKLDVDWRDNEGDPSRAAAIFRKQFLNPPNIYVSGFEIQYNAIADEIKRKGIPNFVWTFAPFINRDSKHNFRVVHSYKQEPRLFFQYADFKKPKKVYLLWYKLPHTLYEFEEVVAPELRRSGIEVKSQPFDIGKKDFKDVVVKINKYNPDLIIASGWAMHLTEILKAARPYGLLEDGKAVFSYDFSELAAVLDKDEIEGMPFAAASAFTRPGSAAKKWLKRLEARFKKPPHYFQLFTYDMVLVINDAARRLRESSSAWPPSSEEWIAALRATDIPGVTGQLKFDDDGSLITPVEVAVFRDGKPVPYFE